MDDSFIHINRVSKSFGMIQAVLDAEIRVRRGEFFSLLGPSGCGKTTLLRMLAGFESPSAGEILIDGMAMSHVPPNKRPTNMVFQNYAIFPHLDVRGNVAYGLRTAGLTKSEVDGRVEEALSMVKLAGYEKRRANELSGGQRQRVALARALVKRPKVLLLDEPLGALDKKLREQMQLELRSLQQSVGVTFIFVTHDQEEALTMSDRIAVMDEGRVLQIAHPRELYERPANVTVAQFIGQINLLEGTVRSADGDGAVVETRALGTVRARASRNGATPQGEVVVAVRPEKLLISSAPPGGDRPHVQGSIGTAAYFGDRSHYFVQIPGSDAPLAVAAQNISTSNALSGEVFVTWEEDSLLVLESRMP